MMDDENDKKKTDDDALLLLSSTRMLLPKDFRQQHTRTNLFTGPTNTICPGYQQCNLVVLPGISEGPWAFDFLLFCQRNPQACPLLEVCEGLYSYCPQQLAIGADLRTDLPKYAIYRNGTLEKEVLDVVDVWPDNAIAFLIGCSFSYDQALRKVGIPLRSVEQHKNVPMFRTNIPCQSAGSMHGNLVVSMKPIPAQLVSQEVQITSRFPHAHGCPVCIGCPGVLGIQDINQPDWGEPIEVQKDEVPVFHACGVTPQAVIMESKVPFAITHAPGHMFVTDIPADFA